MCGVYSDALKQQLVTIVIWGYFTVVPIVMHLAIEDCIYGWYSTYRLE